MNQSADVLFQLLRAALGDEVNVSLPNIVDWREVLGLASEQGVAVLAADGLQKIRETNPDYKLDIDSPQFENLKYEWLGCVMATENQNEKVNKDVEKVFDFFYSHNKNCCLLKGQGLSEFYPIPNHRQSGDIDIWVERARDDISFYRSLFPDLEVKYHHMEFPIVDSRVELHFTPSFCYNPFKNRRLQRYFELENMCFKDELFRKINLWRVPSVSFNRFFLLHHMYRHFLGEGLALKQIVDYAVVLRQGEQDDDVMSLVKEYHMFRFTAALMWVLRGKLGVKEELLLCEPNNELGCKLLDAVLTPNVSAYKGKSRFKRTMSNFYNKRHLLVFGWSEIVWYPYHVVMNHLWQKKNGYLPENYYNNLHR